MKKLSLREKLEQLASEEEYLAKCQDGGDDAYFGKRYGQALLAKQLLDEFSIEIKS